MTMLKKTILSLALFTSIAVNGFSQTKQEAIKDLFRLMKTDALIDKTFNSIAASLGQQRKAERSDDPKGLDEHCKRSLKKYDQYRSCYTL